MEYNKFVDLSKSYLFCQLKRNELTKSEGYHPRLLPFITISREAGTGESAITNTLLDELSSKQPSGECPWTLYDKDLVKRVVQDYNLTGIQGLLPERKFSDIQTMFEELFGLHPTKREMAHNISKSIIKLADMGNVIIVGRGSFYITRHHRNGLHIRLIGSLQQRVKHMVDEYTLTLKQAEEYIKKEDCQRHDYVKKLFGVDLNDPHHYDLVINTDKLLPQEIIALISDHIELLKEKLALNYYSEELTAV
ncbi:MAG TPA: cytidylate kinase-like family protein [Ignavibacteria bacterium]|mgnify:CR=1 FL=1|nr:cytidylate kinase-like family protein [Ignavibacteria bacterium]HMQ99104.1 cytidylate kinase-like family protein [Ignavibacteria bacterium]